jgi:hypothetical protein
MTTEGNMAERRISGFEHDAKPVDSLRFPHESLGQSYPQHYPHHPTDEYLSLGPPAKPDALGEPLSIREVARLLGCSVWTVRHGYLPQGLPHFRSGPMGKLVFYRNQVVRWILQQQQQRKGGI